MKLLQPPRSVKIAVSLSLIATLLYLFDWSRLAELDRFAPLYIGAGVAGTLWLNLFMASRWRLLVASRGGQSFSLGDAYRGYLTGAFFNIFMPGAIGGDLMRIHHAMARAGIDLKRSSAIVVMERLFGIGALCSLFLIGLLLAGDAMPRIDLGGSFPLLLGGALLLLVLIITLAARRLRLPPGTALAVYLLSLTAQGSDALVSWLILSYLHPGAPLFWLLIAMPLAIIATLLPISLGGLGVREGALVGLLALFGIDPSSAILFSFMVYLSKVLVGLIGGIMLNFGHSAPEPPN